MNDRFAGRVGVVTGAGGALGRATAQLLAAEGARLLLFDRDAAGLAHTQALCRGSALHAGDVTSASDLAAARERAEAELGPVEMVAAAAGIMGPVKPLIEVEEEEFGHVVDVNVKGSWLTAKTFIPGMCARRRGSVVLFSSVAGLVGSQFLSAYAVSKGAVTLLTRSLALNHAADNVRVNCVCPGTIASPMVDRSFDVLPEGPERDGRIAAMRSRHPLGRFGTAQEVAQAVAYLLSDEASFTTGVALPVDGGRLA